VEIGEDLGSRLLLALEVIFVQCVATLELAMDLIFDSAFHLELFRLDKGEI
jgi:hypothetical protein